MTETLISCASFLVIIVGCALRLNMLRANRATTTRWQVLEAVGLVLALAGCVTAIGEWFMPPDTPLHAETIFAAGMALWVFGVSNGVHLCQLVARLRGWDGAERRGPLGVATVDPVVDRRWRS